jgi:hypothetical protein
MTDIDLEKSMRRVELKRLYERPGAEIGVDDLVELARRFIAHAERTEDWRFLNTALKIGDGLRAAGVAAGADLAVLEDAALATVARRAGVQP